MEMVLTRNSGESMELRNRMAELTKEILIRKDETVELIGRFDRLKEADLRD